MLVDASFHLQSRMEHEQPMLVHGPFLWYGRDFAFEWLHSKEAFLNQLEDGEIVPAEAVYCCANELVMRFMRQHDVHHLAVDIDGWGDTLLDALTNFIRSDEYRSLQQGHDAR